MIFKAQHQATEALIRQLGRAWPQRCPRLIRLPEEYPVVFIGDIHGDLDAANAVFSRFPASDHILVFLGDIVDRGPDSRKALACIAAARIQAPANVHLLMGNHEAFHLSPFRPADFWESLRKDEAERLSHHFEKLPLAAWYPAGILATHGGIPDVASLDAMEDIELGDEAWRAVAWGDWVDDDSRSVPIGKRPSFGPTAFETRTSRLGIRVHIRSHQPSSPIVSFSDRCLTLFTSCAYGNGKRHVARCNPGRSIASVHDIDVIDL